jgi:hypothetical protein
LARQERAHFDSQVCADCSTVLERVPLNSAGRRGPSSKVLNETFRMCSASPGLFANHLVLDRLADQEHAMDWDDHTVWYHGSPIHLSVLHLGSTITQDRNLARIFSHKPTLVSQDVDDDGRVVLKHTGTQSGFLYQITEALQPDDVYEHPETTLGPGQEWLTRRELCVKLLEPTQIREDEILSDAEVAELKRRH